MNMFGKAGPIAQSPAMQQLPWARPFNDFQALASQGAQQPASQQTLADTLRRRTAGGGNSGVVNRAAGTLAGSTYSGMKAGG